MCLPPEAPEQGPPLKNFTKKFIFIPAGAKRGNNPWKDA